MEEGERSGSLSISDLQDGSTSHSPEDLRAAARMQGLFGQTPLQSSASTYDLSRKDRPNIPKIGNFQQVYIKRNLWPQLSYLEQCQLKQEYTQLQDKYSAKVHENTTLRMQLVGSGRSSSCENCQKEREKRLATELALSQAVELSNVLLKEVRRLDGELVRVSRSPPE